MTELLQQILNGLVVGSNYALIALGLTIIFGILEVVNFAHGEVYMLGAFVTLFGTTMFGVPFLLAIPISMVIIALFGMIIERLIFRPILGKPPINGMLLSFGLSVFLMNIALYFFTADPRKIDSSYSHKMMNFLGLHISLERLIAIVLAFILVVILFMFIQRTKLGKAMRSVAQDREAAQLVGINVSAIYTVTFAIGCALAAAAGSIMGAIFLVTPTMGWTPVLKSFVVVILGGFGNVPGAVLAALILGQVESLAGGYISYEFKDAYAFILLLLAFLFRPQGLLGGAK